MSRVAVVGAGAWGKNLVRNFHSLGALGMICDTDPEALKRLRALYPEVPATGDFDEVLENPDLDGIAIATPADTHFDLARRALLSQAKHLFVEKPLALKVEEGRELIRIAEERECVLMVGHLLHYHPAVLKLRDMMERGEFGRVLYIQSTRANTGRIRHEENVLWSFAPHDISVIMMLLGEEPTGVRTNGWSHLRRDFPDVTNTVLDFAGGVQGHVFTSWIHPEKEQKLVVVGDESMAVFDDVNGEVLRVFQHKLRSEEESPVVARGPARSISVDRTEPLKRECMQFLESLSNGNSPPTDAWEALRVLEVLDACQRSMERGGERVPIKWHGSTGSSTNGGGVHPSAFVHETALVDPGAKVGAGTKIWHFSHVLRETSVGPNCNLGQNVVVGPEVSVGAGCKIQNNVTVCKGVTLEEEVFCGPSVIFTNVRIPRAAVPRMDRLEPTIVRKGATLGGNATIVCGVEIGHHAFVGAGALVTKDVPPYSLFLGHPARWAGWMCACGERLPAGLSCPSCGECYEVIDEGLLPLARPEP